MFLLSIIIGTVGVFVLGLIVFGGGQVFMPLFSSLWKILHDSYGTEVDDQTIQNIFTIVNSTPGVVSTKLAAITGLLIANGQWWGWIAIFLTYSVFILPSIFLMWFANRMFIKLKKSSFVKYIKWFKPVVAGILASLAVQLFLGIIMPQYTFNAGYLQYITQHINPPNNRSNFFSGWRFWVLLFWVPAIVVLTAFLRRKKVSILLIIVGIIGLSFVVFEPWLN